jgi:hypothetical protein
MEACSGGPHNLELWSTGLYAQHPMSQTSETLHAYETSIYAQCTYSNQGLRADSGAPACAPLERCKHDAGVGVTLLPVHLLRDSVRTAQLAIVCWQKSHAAGLPCFVTCSLVLTHGAGWASMIA